MCNRSRGGEEAIKGQDGKDNHRQHHNEDRACCKYPQSK